MSISKAIFSITGINVLGIGVAILNSMVLAQYFGTSREIEIYFSMTVLLQVIMKLSQGGEMSEIIIPIYHKYKETEGIHSAQNITSVIFNWYAVILILIALIVSLLSTYLVQLIAPGFSLDDQRFGAQIIRSIIPLVVLIFLSGQIQSLLNAEKIFGKAEVVNLISRIIAVLVILLSFKSLGIWSVVFSLWVSTCLQFIGLGAIYLLHGNRYYFVFQVKDSSVLHIMRKIWSTYPYIMSTQIWTIVLNAGLSLLPQGNLAIYNYVRILLMRIQGVMMRPISTVFYAHYSQGYAKGATSLKALTHKSLNYYLLTLFTVLIMILFSGKSGLAFLWSGDNFGLEEIGVAHRILLILYITLFISGLSMITRRIALTAGYVKEVYFMMTISQLITAACAWIVIERFGMSGVISAILLNVVLLYLSSIIVLGRRRKEFVLFYKLSELFKWMIALSFGCGVMLFVLPLIGITSIQVNNRFDLLIEIIFISIASSFSILIAAYLLKTESLLILGTKIKKKFGSHFA